MFAYCGNNSANRFDPTGQYMVGIDFVNRAGGIPGLSSSATGGGANSTIQDMSKKGISQGKRTPSFSPGKRDPKELRRVVLRDIMSVVKEIESLPDKYPIVKAHEGANDIYAGVNNIKTGAALLYLPTPTVIDDLVGVGYCAYGILQAAGGFVKVVVAADSL